MLKVLDVDDKLISHMRSIAELATVHLQSEEDVKNKVVLPILRALGYEDLDFNFERRTGRGYVDVVLERYPVGIVIETKALGKPLDSYLQQLEYYVFLKHSNVRQATIAILTDGDFFRVFAVTEAFRAGTLSEFEVMEPFRRANLAKAEVINDLWRLLARGNNETGAALEVIPKCLEAIATKRAQMGAVELELAQLLGERDRIDARIRELEAQTQSFQATVDDRSASTKAASQRAELEKRPESPHILRLLHQRQALSQSAAVDRKWLDEQMIGKIPGVNNHTSVSFSLIDLKRLGMVDYVKIGSSPIRSVWLTADGARWEG